MHTHTHTHIYICIYTHLLIYLFISESSICKDWGSGPVDGPTRSDTCGLRAGRNPRVGPSGNLSTQSKTIIHYTTLGLAIVNGAPRAYACDSWGLWAVATTTTSLSVLVGSGASFRYLLSPSLQHTGQRSAGCFAKLSWTLRGTAVCPHASGALQKHAAIRPILGDGWADGQPIGFLNLQPPAMRSCM